MTRFIAFLIISGFSMVLIQSEAKANAVRYLARCSDDSLDSPQAIERVEWATKCNYIDGDDRHDCLMTASNQPRPKPQYPVFTTPDMTGIWRAPIDRNAPCVKQPGYEIKLYCTASCYTPEQEVLFPEGFVPIKEAKEAGLPKVITLDDGSTMRHLLFKESDVATYTMEVTDTWHDILKFNTQSGGELKVTKNHPIVDGKGKVKTADSFKVGEALVHYLYGSDPIVDIAPMRYFGKVYNLAPNNDTLVSHVLVAQGFLNGSSWYQNDGINFLNRKLLRKQIPTALIE